MDSSSFYYFSIASKISRAICLNDETMVLDTDTGLVKVCDGTNTAYLGTGILGDRSRDNVTFDSLASEVGVWYRDNSSRDKGEYAGTLNAWSPIGTKEKPFEGNFDGDGHKIFGMYVSAGIAEYSGFGDSPQSRAIV